MIKLLFIFSVITTPFSDFVGLHMLGEMQHDLSCHVMTLALLCFLVSSYSQWLNKGRYIGNNLGIKLTSAESLLRNILIVYYFVILASLAANFTTIMNTYAQERYGLGKLFASTIMITYGFAFAFLVVNMASKYSWHDVIIRPLAISLIVCTFFAILEGMSQNFGGFMKTIQLFVSELTHAGSRGLLCMGQACGGFGWYDDTPGRIRSVSFEPPAFADFIGLAWGWIYGGYIASTGKRKTYYALLCWLGLVLMYFSGARTGYIFLALNLSISFLLRYIYLSEKKYAKNAASITSFLLKGGFIIFIVMYTYLYNDIVEIAVRDYDWRDGRSISNLTRLSMTTAGWHIFFDHPILGIGFGQYGFFVKQYLPSWSWQSWEIRSWFIETVGGIWPSTFSTYVRFASEMGVCGLLLWIGTWFMLARSVLKVTIEYKKLTNTILVRAYPLIMGCYAVLLRGVASDALHVTLIWINLGLCCLYITEVKKLIVNAKGKQDISEPDIEIKSGKITPFYFY